MSIEHIDLGGRKFLNMKKIIQLAAVGAMAVGGLYGSSITTPSEVAGTIGTYGIASFDAKATNMVGLKVVVTWSDNSTATCTWSGTGGCGSASRFSISEADGTSDAYNGTWSITNLFNPSGPNPTITKVQLIGSGVDNPTGLVGFDICWNGSPSSGSQNWTNAGASGGTCGNEGTPGTNIGWTASGLSGGRNISTSSVTYTDRVRLSSGPANGVGDEFSEVTLNFGSGVFTDTSSAFTWRMDADLLTASVPEPATFGLVGLSLLALGGVRTRRRKTR
jgi:hypothetical protein